MSRIVSETQTFHPSGLEVLDANGAAVTVSNVNNFRQQYRSWHKNKPLYV